MEIRKLRNGEDLFAVSRVYEASWRRAYRGLLPQEYLDSLPSGKWVPYLKQAGRESLLLLDGDKIVGTASCRVSRLPELSGWGEIVSLYTSARILGKRSRETALFRCGGTVGGRRLPGSLFVGAGGKSAGQDFLWAHGITPQRSLCRR